MRGVPASSTQQGNSLGIFNPVVPVGRGSGPGQRNACGNRGGVGVAVGLGDLRGLFQPSWFCDSPCLMSP